MPTLPPARRLLVLAASVGLVATTAATVRIAATRDTEVAIEADVTNPRPLLRGGAPIYAPKGPAAGARTTSGTAGKYAAISERDLRSAAVP